jgi:hypothetical protein
MEAASSSKMLLNKKVAVWTVDIVSYPNIVESDVTTALRTSYLTL